METQEKVGEVSRPPLEALKKICEESSTARVIGGDLARFERVTDRNVKAREAIKQGRTIDSKIQENGKTPLFTEEDMNKLLHRDEISSLEER